MFYYYSRFETGHRKAYMDFVESKYGAERISCVRLLFTRKPVLFLMAEERPVYIIFCMFFRGALGFRTLALLFRLRPILDSQGVFSSVKRRVLKIIVKISRFGFISIIPEDIYPEVKDVCRYNIFDFQFWDQLDRSSFPSSKRDPGMAVVGRQNHEKGFHYISGFIERFKVIDSLKVYGQIDESCRDYLQDIKVIVPNSDVRNGFVSEDEILDAYARCRYIWCCYSPDYDQSSGVLGRAIQFGNVPVVRRGSLSERYCRLVNANFLSVEILNDAVSSYEYIPRSSEVAFQLNSMPAKFLDIVKGDCGVSE